MRMMYFEIVRYVVLEGEGDNFKNLYVKKYIKIKFFFFIFYLFGSK